MEGEGVEGEEGEGGRWEEESRVMEASATSSS